MTIMDFKVLAIRLLFWGILAGGLVVFSKFCSNPLKEAAAKAYINCDREAPPEFIGGNIRIADIASVETGYEGITSKIYLKNGESRTLTTGIKQIYQTLGKECNCFIYSKGHDGHNSFIFSSKHVRSCEITEGYYRNISLAGGREYRINKDIGAKLNKLMNKIAKCSSFCRRPCCKWKTE